MKNKLDEIIKSIDNIINHSNRDTFVIGISGGIDSCLTLKILHDYFSKYKILAYYLPIENNNELESINLIENSLNINIEKIDLTNLWIETIKEFGIENPYNSYNIKSKIRNMFLFSKAFENNGIVISNLNYDEYFLGYFTKFGDSNGDVYPLINLCKKDIFNLANYLNLPIEIIQKEPSADLFIGQTDENDFGFSYDELDKFLNNQSIDKNIEKLIIEKANNNKHKQVLNHLIKNNFRKV